MCGWDWWSPRYSWPQRCGRAAIGNRSDSPGDRARSLAYGETTMSTAVITGRIAEASPSFKARMAGVLYLLSLCTAIVGESFARGASAIALGLIAVAGMIAVTLLVYDIVRPVNESLAWFAPSFSLAGLTLEALRWNPQGIDIAMVLHGLYCALMGCLVFRSAFLPRFLGALMLVGGLGW